MRNWEDQLFPMPCMVSRSLGQAFHHPTLRMKSAAFSFHFKVSKTLCSFTLNQHSQSPIKAHSRRSISNKSEGTPKRRHTDGFEYGQSGLPIELQDLISSKYSAHETDWGAVIDPYLPPNLRHGGGSIDVVSTRPITALPQIMDRARQQSKIDLLSVLGVSQGRWEAVLWLVEAMMKDFAVHKEAENRFKELSNMLWPSNGQSLDELLDKPVHVQSPGVSRISLESVMDQKHDRSANEGWSLTTQSLGQIWESLGAMILQAADRSPDDLTYSIIMSHVFRILGFLHRLGAFPKTIYNFISPTDPTVIQRPPTLYLLSKRIMSALSDVEFSLQREQEIKKHKREGHENDTTDTTLVPEIHEFGPELWLDLVLWACVEGGWITEGAWIIGEMERRKASRDTSWLVISWQQICAREEPKLDLASIFRYQIQKVRLNQVGGIGIATGGDFTVDMGTRTISREVALAIMDGLLNNGHLHAKSTSSKDIATVERGIVNCKNLLGRGQSDIDVDRLNATILRMIENGGVDGNDVPGVLQRILDIRSLTAKQIAPTKPLHPKRNDKSDDAAPILGLLHRSLYGFASEGNIQGSLATLKKIQGLIDVKREESITAFANQLKIRSHELDLDEDENHIEESKKTAGLPHQIPVHALIAFLDLLTVSKFFDLGKWMLMNDDIDGGIINPEVFSDANLQPALLRFATATADDKLLSQILANIEQPIPEPLLHALLHCQVALGKWSAVEGLFDHFRATPGMSWKTSDAMAIAKAMLQSHRNPPPEEAEDQTINPQDLLANLLQGKYNSPQDPSQPPNFSQPKLANQLGRIFKTLPPPLSNLVTNPTTQDTKRAHASTGIPPFAFNILLEAIIDHSGPVAGKALWERWCCEPFESIVRSEPQIKHVIAGQVSQPISPPGEEDERVVKPKPYMLRSILRPILRVRRRPRAAKKAVATAEDEEDGKVAMGFDGAGKPTSRADGGGGDPGSEEGQPVRRPLTQSEQRVLEWGIDMFREFGLSDKEINAEIPGAVAIPRR